MAELFQLWADGSKSIEENAVLIERSVTVVLSRLFPGAGERRQAMMLVAQRINLAVPPWEGSPIAIWFVLQASDGTITHTGIPFGLVRDFIQSSGDAILSEEPDETMALATAARLRLERGG